MQEIGIYDSEASAHVTLPQEKLELLWNLGTTDFYSSGALLEEGTDTEIKKDLANLVLLAKPLIQEIYVIPHMVLNRMSLPPFPSPGLKWGWCNKTQDSSAEDLHQTTWQMVGKKMMAWDILNCLCLCFHLTLLLLRWTWSYLCGIKKQNFCRFCNNFSTVSPKYFLSSGYMAVFNITLFVSILVYFPKRLFFHSSFIVNINQNKTWINIVDLSRR